MAPRFYPLWAINAPLDERRLFRQLESMRSWGFDGVVFHPRFYPNVPPYLSEDYLRILSRVILHARSLGLEFWIYDENGWPSGTVGGELLKHHPADVQRWLGLTTEPSDDCIHDFERKGRHWYLGCRQGNGLDYLKPEASGHFLQMTHERYRTGLDPAAFAHVSAFFSDEPEFGLGHAYDSIPSSGAIPWTPRLPELFEERYGEDLPARLPLLFFPDEGYRALRVKFWELLTDLFVESFMVPLDQWCRKHGKRFTAHVKGEEHPLFQVPIAGSCHQVMRQVGLPGIDALERFPSGHFFPRQVASVAKQFGNGECMVECFGGAGWGAGPEDLERYLNWLVGHGLTHFVTHLYQYRLTTHALQDWPPSHPGHMTWVEAWPEVIKRVKVFAAKTAASKPATTLVVAPYRGIMEEFEPRELLQINIHNAATYPDTAAGRLNTEFLQMLNRVHESGAAYHVSDERSVEQYGEIKSGKLFIGHCGYDTVISDQGTKWRAEGVALLKRFEVQGGVMLRDSGIAPVREKAHPASFSPGAVCNVEWKLKPASNDLVLEVEASGDSQFVASFEANERMEIDLFFADDIGALSFNGRGLEIESIDDGSICHVPDDCVKQRNEIRFQCLDKRTIPFLAVRGKFYVRSLSPYVEGPNHTVKTEGPFVLDRVTEKNAHDLIEAGYPFCRSPLILTGVMELREAANSIQFQKIQAACAQVTIDDRECGWCWGPGWRIVLQEPLAAGRHPITMKLIPSAFNFFGPHRHIDGDRSPVSPDQFLYRKNFADRADAPECTRGSFWHFRPLGIGAGMRPGTP